MRIDYGKLMPAARDAMLGLQRAADAAGLDEKLVELVKIRASQLNGCAFCLDMHAKDALAIGEDQDRLNLVAAWREAPCFSDRERAALAWTESLTLLPETGAPDADYEQARSCFSEEELVGLTYEVVAINAWNRLAVSMRTPAGRYVSRRGPGKPA